MKKILPLLGTLLMLITIGGVCPNEEPLDVPTTPDNKKTTTAPDGCIGTDMPLEQDATYEAIMQKSEIVLKRYEDNVKKVTVGQLTNGEYTYGLMVRSPATDTYIYYELCYLDEDEPESDGALSPEWATLIPASDYDTGNFSDFKRTVNGVEEIYGTEPGMYAVNVFASPDGTNNWKKVSIFEYTVTE